MTIDTLIPYMPHVQAVLNALAAVLLFSGYRYIKDGSRIAHRNCMIGALVVSTIFLVSYLTYHARVGYQPFEGQGLIRPFYFTILFSHIILSGVIVPMVLVTVYFALKGNFNKHPRVARWTLPVWLYISISGVVVYLLAFHVYPPQEFVWESMIPS
jgi:putative membrane protein